MSMPEIQERTFSNLVKRRIAQKFGKNGAAAPARGKVYGAGLIGAGNIARWAYMPRLQPKTHFRLAAVFDVNQAGAKEVAASAGAKACASMAELVRDPEVEVVFICTPSANHCEASLAALEAGKHVLCEKPMAHTLDEARRMYDAAKKAGKAHMVHFSYRLRPEFSFLAQLLRSGIIGRVYHVTGTFSQGRWFTDKSEPSSERVDAAPWKFGPDGGVGGDLGPHLVDLLRYGLGEITSVTSWVKSFRPGPYVSDDACGITLQFGEGPVAHVVTSRLATAYKDRSLLEFSGSLGAIHFEDGVVRLWTRSEPRWRTLLIPPSCGKDFLEVFYSAVNQPGSPVPDFSDGMRNNEVLEAIAQSAKTGQTVKLPLAS